VLFADVKGSMELAESVDVEEWHRIMDRFFAVLAEGVHRFEGTIGQYTGDGIMALFGAPLAHEDHAQRACHAALYLRDALRAYAQELRRRRGLDFAVRLGLNSGAVVVGTIGDDLRMEYTAQGHTVGLAARMEQLAEAGRVYLSEATAALASGYFRLEDLGAFDVKGVRDPVRVYELQGPGTMRTRLDAARARGLSRFVGRARETDRLAAGLERARAGPALMAIVAEAGAGKSRLLAEFAAAGRRRGTAVFETHAPAHGRRIPNLAAAELFRSLFGIGPRDDDRAAREKVAGRLVLLDAALGEHLPLVFELLGVGEPNAPPAAKDPEVRERRLLAVARRVLEDAAAQAPAVVVWEDLHWLDEASEGFLRALLGALREAHALVLLSFRPEYAGGWLAEHEIEALRLAPLADDAVTELLRDLLGESAPVAGLAARIRAHTAGNPFFIEEVVRSLFECGALAYEGGEVRAKTPAAALRIPSTVQAVLAARIDALPPAVREVLQTAAVIGKRFSRSVLERVLLEPGTDVQRALDDLVAAEFLFVANPETDPEYVFKHPLTQEVADQSQLAEHRQRVHAAVARAMEALHGERAGERAALIAYHWEGAGDLLTAAEWLRRAAAAAASMGPREEMRHWRRARELLAGRAEDDALHLRITAAAQMIVLGTRIAEVTEDPAALFAEGCDLAERLTDRRPAATLFAARAVSCGVCGERTEALQRIGEARAIATAAGDRLLAADVATVAVNVYEWFGLYRELAVVCDEALALLDASGAPPRDALYAYLLVAKGLSLGMGGALVEAGRTLERGMQLAEEGRDPETIGRAHLELAFHALDKGDPPAALAHATAAREIGERLGSGSVYGPAFVAFSAAQAACGQLEDARTTLSLMREVLRHARAGRTFEGVVLAFLADVHLGLADPIAALSAAEEALVRTHRDGTLGYEIRAQLALARALRAAAGAAAAERVRAAVERAEALVEETGARAYTPFARIERAELARLLGDEATCERELREAHRQFIEMGATGHADRLAPRLADSTRS
jgi:class 3 adenylate cyclase